jgi:hypothetical protein
MLDGIPDDRCTDKVTAPCKRQYGFAAGHENKHLGLGIGE